MREFLGVKLELVEDDISFQKRVHKYHLKYKQSSCEGTILSFCSNLPESVG